ncbi:MAG: hypothetical protein Kow0069_28060 [Promethearchaeota archaeon]
MALTSNSRRRDSLAVATVAFVLGLAFAAVPAAHLFGGTIRVVDSPRIPVVPPGTRLSPTPRPAAGDLPGLLARGSVVVDGHLFEWTRDDLLAVVPPAEGPSGIDVLAAYSRVEGSSLFLRLDASGLLSADWGSTVVELDVEIPSWATRTGPDQPVASGASLEVWPGLTIAAGDPGVLKVLLRNPSRAEDNLVLAGGAVGTVAAVAYDSIAGGVELEVPLPAASPPHEALPAHPKVNVVVHGRNGGSGQVPASSLRVATFGHGGLDLPSGAGSTPSPASTGTVKVAFVHHGNQPYRATDWRGKPNWLDGIVYDPQGVVDHDNGVADGYHYGLAAHEDYQVPMDLELTTSLLSGLQYENPEFLDRVKADVESGLVDLVGTVYAQQKLPYYTREMNEWAISWSKNFTREVFDPNGELGLPLNVLWVPDRTWKDQPQVVLPVATHYSAVVLDDRPHHDDFGSGDYHHVNAMESSVSSYDGGLYAFFICSTFRDQVFNPGALQSHWATLAASGDPHAVCVYGDDWEKACGNGFFDNGDDYASWYRDTIHAVASLPWVEKVTLTDVASNVTVGSWPVTDQITVVSDTAPYIDGNGYHGTADEFYYGLSGYHDQPNHYDYWYDVWSDWVPDDVNPYFSYSTKNLDQTWRDAADAVYGAPFENRLVELGKHVLAASQHETAFGSGELNWGNERLFDWQKRQSEHARYAHAFAYAANWANGVANGSVTHDAATASLDVDDDGVAEVVLHNANLLAVFDPVGGKLQWLFGHQNGYPQLLAGNSIAFYDGNDYHTGGVESGFGDYNDYGHQYPLSDSLASKVTDDDPFDFDLNHVSQPRSTFDVLRLDNFTYSLTTQTAASNATVTAQCSQAGLTKSVTLTDDGWDLQVTYDDSGGAGRPVYVFSGFTPNLLSLIEEGNFLSVEVTNRSWTVKNDDYPAAVGLEWTTGTVNLTYQESSLFEERAELVGTGTFSFNVTARPPSPVRVHDVAYSKPALGVATTVNASVYSLTGTTITGVLLQARTFNGTWSAWQNFSMTWLGGTRYSGTIPSNLQTAGNQLYFRVYARDDATPPNEGYSRTYDASGGEPIYHSVVVDGVNDFHEDELVASDPPGDSGDPQVDLTSLYATWDAENLYLGLDVRSTVDLTSWGGSSPSSFYLAFDSVDDAGYSNVSNTPFGDMWNRAIRFNGTRLPDLQLHATINKDSPYLEYSAFDNETKAWSAGNSTGASYAYAATTWGVFVEFSVSWDALRTAGPLTTALGVSAGACGGTDGDSAVDSCPDDPATRTLVGGASEWVDVDTFDSNLFANVEWDANGDGVPDYVPAVVDLNLPANGSTVNGSVPVDLDVTASTTVQRVNASLHGEVLFDATYSSNVAKVKFAWDSTNVENGPALLEVAALLGDDSVVRAWIALDVLNKYATTLEATGDLPGQVTLGQHLSWNLTFHATDAFGHDVAGGQLVVTVAKTTYEASEDLVYLATTNATGGATLSVQLDAAATYGVSATLDHPDYLPSSVDLTLVVAADYGQANLAGSGALLGLALAALVAANARWVAQKARWGRSG